MTRVPHDPTIPSGRLVAIALIASLLGLLCLSMVGCSSPTAPSATYRLTFAPAPGCAPGVMPVAPTTEWIVALRTGADQLTVAWPGLTVEFRAFGSNYLVCRVVGA